MSSQTANTADPGPDDADWDAAYDTSAARTPLPAPAPDDTGEPAPVFDSLEAWVRDWLAPMITVELGQGMRWCPQWWRHAGAIARLEALWRAWEHLRVADDPTAMSLWWRDHADHHLDSLMEGPRSPFRQCSAEPGKGHRDDLQPLPVEPAPSGWFGSAGT